MIDRHRAPEGEAFPSRAFFVRQLTISLLTAVVILLTCSRAAAGPSELVLLVRTQQRDGALDEATNRLSGELAQHGFAVRIVDVPQPPTTSELETRADEAGAVASVALLPAASPGATAQLRKVDVWISDRVTGKTIKRTLSPGNTHEAPTIIAVRALELLRSSLQEYQQARDTIAIEGAHPERASGAVSGLSSSESARTWLVSAGATLGFSFPSGGPSGAPQLSVAYEQQRFGGGLLLLGPLLGNSAEVAPEDFEFLSFTVQLEPYYLPIKTERFKLSLFPSAGASFLQVQGNPDLPYQGEQDSTWVLSVGAGIAARYQLTRLAGFYAAARSLFLLPQPLVAIADSGATLGTPLLLMSAGVVFFL